MIRQSSTNLFPKISCILLNWNGWQDTTACLSTLRECTYPHLEVIVVDNGSSNDSVARIRAAHPQVPILESKTNLGFAAGNNIGIRHAMAGGAEYIWLLNNDTFPKPDALAALLAKAQTDSRIGAVASICYYADDPTTVQAWAGARVNLWTGYTRNSTEPRGDEWFDALYGASMLIAARALGDIGLLDEGFFFYLEETDLCLRLRKQGWLLAAAPESSILHKVSASTGGYKPILERYFTASGLRILELHAPAPTLAMFLFLLARFARRLLRLQFLRCRSVWSGVQDYKKMRPVIQKIR